MNLEIKDDLLIAIIYTPIVDKGNYTNEQLLYDINRYIELDGDNIKQSGDKISDILRGIVKKIVKKNEIQG